MKTNKFLTILALLTFLSFQAFAQEDDEPRFLFEGSDIKLSGFGGPNVMFGAVGDDFALFNGGCGALLINQKFFIGGYGFGLSTNHYRDDLTNITGIEDPKISFGHGGFYFGYIHQPKKMIHFGGSARVGWGQIAVYDEFFDEGYIEDYEGRDHIIALAPQVEVEANLTSWMKLNVGVGYQLTLGMDKRYKLNGVTYHYYDSKDFNKPYANITFMFGWFNQ